MIIERALGRDPAVVAQDFNIGPRGGTRIVDVARIIWDVVGDGRPFKYEVKETDANTAVRREMVPDKIERVIGWRAKTGLRDGIEKTAAWIKTI